MREIFEGICTALVTPFKNGEVDFAALENLIEYQIEGGVQAISVLGTTGEPCTLTDQEKEEIIKFSYKVINNRVKFIVGTGGNNTREVIKNSEFAAQNGADALLVVTPYYNKCTQKGLIEYYNEISKIKCPIIVYNVPSRTGVNILPSTLSEIVKNEFIYGFKQASGNMSELLEILKKNREKIAIYSGEDALNYVFYTLGARGAISVTANAYPKEVTQIYQKIKEDNFMEAYSLQERLFDINNLLFSEVNPIPIKECLSKLGLCTHEVRAPLTIMADNKELLKEMKRLKKELCL